MFRHRVPEVNWGLACVGVLLGLIVLEATLQYRGRVRTDVQVPDVVIDERVGYRPNSNLPGHDSRGWLNASALERADIVVLGDSLVYGSAWPQAVGVGLHRTVYQMAAYGYGPPQYALLADEFLTLRPQVVIATYDFGDDLYDPYEFVYKRGAFKRSSADAKLNEWFAAPDGKSQAALRRAEAIDPGLIRRKYLDCRNPIEPPDPRLQAVRDVLESPPLLPLMEAGNPPHVFTFLADHSVLLDAFRQWIYATKKPREKAEVAWPDLCPRYRDQLLTTLFNPGYRKLVLDYSDPRIVEGERIALRSYRYLAERCKASQCKFYVVVIPTKETAFRHQAEPSMKQQPYMIDLWNAEEEARRRAQTYFTQENIMTIDALPALQKLVMSGVNPYANDADGHPALAGYDAIARTVVARLERDGLAK